MIENYIFFYRPFLSPAFLYFCFFFVVLAIYLIRASSDSRREHTWLSLFLHHIKNRVITVYRAAPFQGATPYAIVAMQIA